MVDLSIIIISYNTKDILFECINSVYKNLPKNYTSEVIVVDNASRDESVNMIKKDFPKAILIENKENFGFSKANNQGVKKSSGRYILFLNSDTIVYENSFSEIINFLNLNKEAGAATCKLTLLNGKLDDASHRGFPTPWNAFCHFSGLSKLFSKTSLFGGYNLSFKDFDKIHEIDACAGAYIMVKKEAGDQIGWWDEDYFWYGDDLDFCFRIKEKGWKIYYVPTVSVLHYKGVSGGIKKHSKHLTTADVETKKLATNARFEAMRLFYKKHYIKKYPKIITCLVMKGIDFKLKIASFNF